MVPALGTHRLADPMCGRATGRVKVHTLRQAFAELLGKPCAEARVAAIVTASLGEPGDHGWFVEALADLQGMGWASSTCSTSTA